MIKTSNVGLIYDDETSTNGTTCKLGHNVVIKCL